MGWMETWFAFSRGEQLVVQTIGSEEGSYLRRIDSVYHSTLGLRVIKREKERARGQVHVRWSELLEEERYQQVSIPIWPHLYSCKVVQF